MMSLDFLESSPLLFVHLIGVSKKPSTKPVELSRHVDTIMGLKDLSQEVPWINPPVVCRCYCGGGGGGGCKGPFRVSTRFA